MANTYTQLYVQFVFAVKGRLSLIGLSWEEELYKYITGIVQNNKHKLIAINGMPDHVHVFVGLHTTQSVADLMRVVKGESSEWINSRKFVQGRFEWQEGYGGFTYSRGQIDDVYKYIMNQKQHHQKISFIDEYIQLLEEFDIAYDKRYIFKSIE
jgi:putative transposase